MSHFTCVFMETWANAGAALVPCVHPGHVPVFALSATQYQTVSWIREHYPRFSGVCTVCQQQTIIYASMEHAEAGQWW